MLHENKTADLGYIQENYKALQQIILLEEKEQELQEEKETTAVSVPFWLRKTQKLMRPMKQVALLMQHFLLIVLKIKPLQNNIRSF